MMTNKLNNTYTAFISILNASLRPNNLPSKYEIILPDNWEEFFHLMHSQAVAGICFDTINKSTENKRCNQRIFLQWAGIANYIKNRNRRAEKAIKDIYELFDQIDVKPVVMKGFSFGLNYPDPEMRMSGDIDLFIPEKYNELILFLQQQGYELTSTEKHHKFYFEDILIELHHHIINKPFKEIAEYQIHSVFLNGVHFRIFDIQTQAILLISHAASHLVGPGIGFRHLCDWVLFIEKYRDELESTSFQKEIKDRHLEKFLIVFTTLANKLFHIATPSYINGKHSHLVEKLMMDMFSQGDCGQVERHIRIQHNKFVYIWMYVKRLFKFVPYSFVITCSVFGMKIQEITASILNSKN